METFINKINKRSCYGFSASGSPQVHSYPRVQSLLVLSCRQRHSEKRMRSLLPGELLTIGDTLHGLVLANAALFSTIALCTQNVMCEHTDQI